MNQLYIFFLIIVCGPFYNPEALRRRSVQALRVHQKIHQKTSTLVTRDFVVNTLRHSTKNKIRLSEARNVIYGHKHFTNLTSMNTILAFEWHLSTQHLNHKGTYVAEGRPAERTVGAMLMTLVTSQMTISTLPDPGTCTHLNHNISKIKYKSYHIIYCEINILLKYYKKIPKDSIKINTLNNSTHILSTALLISLPAFQSLTPFLHSGTAPKQ